MNKEFQRYSVTATGLLSLSSVNVLFDSLLEALKTHVPEGRYLSIVRTKLEEACFFAAKGISENPDNQEKR